MYFCSLNLKHKKMKKTLLLIAFVGCFTLINAQTKPDNGWWCAAEVHTAGFWYPPKVSNGVVGLSFTNGYRFSEYIRIGVGFGILASQEYGDYVNQSPYKRQAASLPLFLNARGSIMSQESRKCVPYWNADVGYAFLKDLFFFDAGIGMRVGGRRHSFVLSANYFGQTVEKHYQKEAKFSNGILFKIGYEF